MPEIKHTFQAGKMNKDLDERLVPNGEYRDALNIEIRTSDGSDIGAAQTITGNTKRMTSIDPTKDIEASYNWAGIKSEVVGSIANEKTNKCYFLIASPPVEPYVPSLITTPFPLVFRDTIVEYDTDTRKINPVFNDVFQIHAKKDLVGLNNEGQVEFYENRDGFSCTNEELRKHLRKGMQVQAFDTNGNELLVSQDNFTSGSWPIIKSVSPVICNSQGGYPTPGEGETDIVNAVYFDRRLTQDCIDLFHNDAIAWVFKIDNVLEFYVNSYTKSKTITGINIIDDFLFWTDGRTEPKKINIKRCKAGTSDFNYHTKLMISRPNSLSGELARISSIDTGTTDDIKKEHITVIKKSPRTAPRLIMSKSSRASSEGVCTNPFIDNNNETGHSQTGDILSNVNISGATFFIGDQLEFNLSLVGAEQSTIRATVLSVNNDGTYEIEVLSVPNEISLYALSSYTVKLIEDKPLFELKFGRFAYRYKYQDGEYSTFSPWSRLAFLPGEFDYVPVKGYNLGMVNHVRSLTITDFIVENDQRPDDVVEVDILYKDTESPNVYVVKSIRRGVDPEWDKYGQSGTQGSLNITSEMIHLTLPNAQTLRTWDNVPKKAKAQEVTGNRIVYANYVQNYDVKQPLSIIQTIQSTEHAEPSYSWTEEVPEFIGKESVKSIRKYKIGVVFGDEYGRETPVLGMGGATASSGDTSALSINADVSNPKVNAGKVNRLIAQQNWSNPTGDYHPSSWMDYYKYYIKETTNQYYNLAMDRWYDAEDGNVWISFQSSDRNKVDIETYLILKNKHGTNDIVEEEARYKILAISNEAPTYVKTTAKILGSSRISLNDGNDLSNIHNSQVVTLSDDAWSNTFEGVEVKGIAYARIRGIKDGIVKFSKWVKVSRLNHTSHQITTIQPFGDEADMYTMFQQADGSGVAINIEVKEDIIENRPEFDGRFFVKIYRDNTLRDSVLSQTDSGVNYSTVKSFAYAYLSDHGNHPSQAGTYNSGNYSYQSAHGFNAGNVSAEFATCGWATESKAFWNAWGSTSWAGTKWFLHETRSLWENWGNKHRKGLHSYNSSIEGLDAMHFSVSGNGHPPFPTSGIDGEFRSTMQTAGTFFKFRNDPNDTIYVTVGTTSSAASKNYHKNSNGCKDCKDSWGGCGSRTMLVLFTQKDHPTKGVITSEWDPRSELKHDARNKGYIDIVEPFYSNSSKEVFSDGNAIWETEPKEDVGLDLYYEATSALPVILTENNNESFAPINSTVTCIRPITDVDPTTGEISTNSIINLGDTPTNSDGEVSGPPNRVYLESFVRDVVGIREENVLGGTTNKAAIGDRLRFEWPNGTITESEVVEFMQELPSKCQYEYNEVQYLPGPQYNMSVKLNRGCNDFINRSRAVISSGLQPINDDGSLNTSGELFPNVSEGDTDLNNPAGNGLFLWLINNGAQIVGIHIGGYSNDGSNELRSNKGNIVIESVGLTYYEILKNLLGAKAIALDLINVPADVCVPAGENVGNSPELILDRDYAVPDHPSPTDPLWHNINIDIVWGLPTDYYRLDSNLYKYRTQLPWFNCYSFGNGLESDRIRDDFNANTIDNGGTVSSILRTYGEETRSSGLIYSGIYNSTSGVNELNEFNQSQPITKDLNPSYGSIQALKTRDTNLVTFCEDKVFQILANKDALYNADGSSNVTASNAVLGDAKAFVGDYGISLNPESLAVDGYRMYFTDKQRNKVLRLSQDGLTPISDVGMSSYFRDSFKHTRELLGTFDEIKGEYNVSLKHQPVIPFLRKPAYDFDYIHPNHEDTTVSFNEKTKGWVSFKSFVPQSGVSINDEYLTAVQGNIWSHHSKVKTNSNGVIVPATVVENNFYGNQYYSTIDVLFNDNPGSVKSFLTVNYEGTQAKIDENKDTLHQDVNGNNVYAVDYRYDNLTSTNGWYVTEFNTDLQEGKVDEFINKEGKWFNNILGVSTNLENLDSKEFSVQGIGRAIVEADYDFSFNLKIQ